MSGRRSEKSSSASSTCCASARVSIATLNFAIVVSLRLGGGTVRDRGPGGPAELDPCSDAMVAEMGTGAIGRSPDLSENASEAAARAGGGSARERADQVVLHGEECRRGPGRHPHLR